jgi:predicted Zn-dependent peptidase
MTAANAQVDRSKPPVPEKARKIELGEYKTFTLKNGLTAIVVENHELPMVTFSLQLNMEPIPEGKSAGTASFAGQLLRTGTATRNKAQLDKEIDFIGASINTGSGGIVGSGLKKHQDKILELMTDMLYNPVFPNEELEKIRKQTMSALQMNASDPNAIASTVANVLRYGKDHPYGEPLTEETVQAITLDGIKEYYKTYFQPGIAYFIMVGDITLAEGKDLAKKYFDSWKGSSVQFPKFSSPPAVDATSVAFVDKPGAVQSVVTVTNTFNLKPGTPDVLPAALMNNVLGGGVFSGRLMLNLREDKAYTYGATSSLSSDRYTGNFTAGAQVGTNVTDSAVTEFLYEIRRMQDELVSDEDLRMNKDVMAGEFARALESPSTIANFALNTIRYRLPKDYYATYLERLEKITKEEVQAMAKKYLQPDKCIILVVGNKSAIADKLTKFDSNGQVSFYDRYGNPQNDKSLETPADMTAEKVIDRYIQAIGGRDALESVRYITSQAKGKVAAMGREIEIGISTYQADGDKMCQEMRMGDMMMNKQVFDGQKGWTEAMGRTQESEAKDLERQKESARLFPEIFYSQPGFEIKLSGVEKINGSDAYRIEIKSPAGSNVSEFYDVNSGLKIRTVTIVEMQGQTIEAVTDLSDYRAVDGIRFPFVMKQSVAGQSIDTTVEVIDIKTPVDPARFKK